MYQAIENYYIQNETVMSIGQFAVLWGMIEERYFKKYCTASKLTRTDVCVSSQPLASYADSIKRELFQLYDSPDSSQLKERLRIRPSDHGFFPIVQNFLMNEDVDEKDKILAALYICFRIRNNMFHGEKIYWLINYQRDLLDSCADYMNELLLGEDILHVIE